MSTPEDQIKTALSTPDRLFRRMQDAYDASKDSSKVSEFKIRADKPNETYTSFEKILEQIDHLNTQLDKSDQVNCTQTLSSFEDLYYKVKAKESALKALDPPISQGVQAQAPLEVNAPPKIRLPTINVPVFSGEISAFPAFRSLYDQLIHNNADLSDIQKCSYLKAYLSSSAASYIDHISFVAQNYLLAYQSVVERFGKKRVLANTYLSKIFKFSPLFNDHVKGLKGFLDVFQINVESLKGLNIDDLGEFILLQMGLKALDEKTRLEFETKQIKNNFPKFEDLVKFVRLKCAILDLTNDNSVNSNKSQVSNQSSRKAYHVTAHNRTSL